MNLSASVSRGIALSVILLMTMGGKGFALSDWLDVYDFYDAPGSGALDAASDADIRNASPISSTAPRGGFGPPIGSFNIHNSVSSLVQPHPALQFKDRWQLDFASAVHHPHHQQHHRRQWGRSIED